MPAWIISFFGSLLGILGPIFARKAVDSFTEEIAREKAEKEAKEKKDAELAALAEQYKNSQGQEQEDAFKNFIDRAHKP